MSSAPTACWTWAAGQARSLCFSPDPAYRAWRERNRAASHEVTEIPGVGAVESWVEVTDVAGPLVSFRWTWMFASDGQVLTSDSTLRFRDREDVEAELIAHGYVVSEVRDAPDRPGREFVFFAQRPRREHRHTG